MRLMGMHHLTFGIVNSVALLCPMSVMLLEEDMSWRTVEAVVALLYDLVDVLDLVPQ